MPPRSRAAPSQASQARPSNSRRRTRTQASRDSSPEVEADPSPSHGRRAAPSTSQRRARAGEVKPFTPSSFSNRPVDQSSERQMKSFLTNWTLPAGDVEGKAVSLLADTARALEDAGGDEELGRMLEEGMRKVVEAQERIRAHTGVLDSLRQRVARGEKLSDVTEMYTNGVEEQYAAWEGKTARQKYGRNEGYSKFREGVWAGQNGDDQAMPPDFLTRELERERDDDEGSSDEEIAMGGQTQNLKCPLTLRYLTTCLQSRKCKHSYSQSAILDYLGSSHAPKACPATGCDQVVTKEDLVENKELERMARRAEQKERDRAAGLDDEPVEEVDETMVL